MAKRLDPAGFQDLCRGLIKEAKKSYGPLDSKSQLISRSGLRRLLAIAYQASLMTYEGQFRPFTMAIRAGSFALDGAKCLRIRPPWTELTPTSLRDLGRLFPGSPLALCVHERSGELVCDGVVDRRANVQGPPDFLQGDVSDLIVEVLGPGELYVGVGGPGWHLRAGVAVEVQPFAFMPPLHQLGRDCWRRVLAGEPDEQTIENLSFVTRNALGSMLEHAAARRCGGAFAFLPSVRNAPLGSIREADTWPEFGRLIFDWYEAGMRLRNVDVSDDDYQEASQATRRTRSRVQAALRSIAAASTLDGCTVFDSRLKLHGFGAKITAKKVPESIPEIDVGGNVVGALTMSEKGTRHGSAAALASEVPGAVVVVLSQDGGIRVFEATVDGSCRVTLECRAYSLSFDPP